MTQEDKQLLLVDLSARLPYGVKAQVIGWDEEKGEIEIPLRIYSINTDGYVYFETNDYDVNYLAVDACLLYLRPMSSMTEEESAELSNIISEWFDKELFDLIEEPFLEYALSKINYSISPQLFDWLNAHHFDYRGLIPKGSAIEAPNDMY